MFGFGSGASTDRATLEAIGRALAIIEFDPTGKILSANENFCKALGYQATEIIGQHHSLFVEPDYVRSPEYREFWAKLGRGEFDAARIQAHRQGRTERLDPGFVQSGDRFQGQSSEGRQGGDRHHRRKAQKRGVREQDQRGLAYPGRHRVHARRVKSSPPTKIFSACSDTGSMKSKASIIACSSIRPMRRRRNIRRSGAN